MCNGTHWFGESELTFETELLVASCGGTLDSGGRLELHYDRVYWSSGFCIDVLHCADAM